MSNQIDRFADLAKASGQALRGLSGGTTLESPAPALNPLDSVLAERTSQYGPFTGHAQIAQRLKNTMRATPGWLRLQPDQQEALEMVAHKIGRILNGNPDFLDSWVDIEGYTHLVVRRLREDQDPHPQRQSCGDA